MWFEQPGAAGKEYPLKRDVGARPRPGGKAVGTPYANESWTTIDCSA